MKLSTPIIPSTQKFYRHGNEEGLDLKAICTFCAAGFFLAEDTYFKNWKTMQPATEYETDDEGRLLSSKKLWNWHYSPRDISFNSAVDEFEDLFEDITEKGIGNRNAIVALSGGLDSRTQAVALLGRDAVVAYSYKFAGGHNETWYGKEISLKSGFRFEEFDIEEGYLWKRIERLSAINKCYADFTHPRQMAHIEDISSLGEIFYLGHWGDVLFDDMGIKSSAGFDEQLASLKKKIIKKGGIELAEALWQAWGIQGNFADYFEGRLNSLLDEIKIDDANARIRAFKSIYWAPRWTSANMDVFSDFKPVFLPYYHDEMCKFICTIPEEHLAGRKIQIQYVMNKSPEIASIPWQPYHPLNLYTYTSFDSPSRLPSRALRKGLRIIEEKLMRRKRITRNWELQFCGKENDLQLRKRLFENKKFQELVPKAVTETFYNRFRNEDSVRFSHPVSMLLTLSEFCRINLN